MRTTTVRCRNETTHDPGGQAPVAGGLVAPLNDPDMGEFPGSNERGFRHLGCMLRNMWDRWQCDD